MSGQARAAEAKSSDLRSLLHEIADKYPPAQKQGQHEDVERIAYNIQLVTSRLGSDARVCDLGGGVGLFSVGCAAVGMESVLIDDFQDPVNHEVGESILDIHKSYGVEVISRDSIADGLPSGLGRIDAVTSFDSMEHWHHSPKTLFSEVMTALEPNGLFVLGVPNCVNLRKRLTVPLGIGKWSQMSEWYEPRCFRGHVREPDVGDLRYIASDLNLVGTIILGRNWLGYRSRISLVRALTPMADRLLRIFPSLCSDIYLVGHKGS